jgi:catechol 1,2-dioxygenase
MDRKKFILTSSLAAFSLTTCGTVMKNEQGELVGDCETTNDILGPFYRANAPKRSDLTTPELKGTRILLKGQVFGSDCKTVLKDALVEIWHCDSNGDYDNDSDEFRQRATWKTNEKGEYSFQTILPGKYLNGQLYRPSHIHYRVTAAEHKELISQIYFKGDPHIAKDPWASQAKAQRRILEISPVDIKGNLELHFDLFLSDK